MGTGGRTRVGGAAVFGLDAAEAAVGEEPAAVARVEGGDGVAAAAQEGGEGRARSWTSWPPATSRPMPWPLQHAPQPRQSSKTADPAT